MTTLISRIVVGGLIASLAAVAGLAQDTSAPMPFETREMGQSFYLLEGGGGNGSNVGVLLGETGVLLVDAMMATSSERLEATVRTLSTQPVTHVINTHGDADHSGGNEKLAARGATIVGQENVLFREVRTYPMKTFDRDLEISVYDEVVKLHAVLSHSPDDVIVFLSRNNVVFMGDTLATDWHPTLYAGGLDGQLEAIDLALSLGNEETVFVPGHGVSIDRRGLEAYRRRCEEWIANLGRLVDAGRSVEEMMADPQLLALRRSFNLRHEERPIPDASFERFIRRSLATEFVPAVSLAEPGLDAYLGEYRFEDGSALSLTVEGDKIFARQPGSDSYQVIPVSPSRFRVRGRTQDHYLMFEFGAEGLVTSVALVDPDESRVALRGTSR